MTSSAATLDEFFKAYVVTLCEKNCDVAMFSSALNSMLWIRGFMNG